MDFDKFVLTAAKMITRGVWTDEEAQSVCQYEAARYGKSFDEVWGLVQAQAMTQAYELMD